MEDTRLKEILLWRLGQVDGKLHTLLEVSKKYDVTIAEFLLAERALHTRKAS